ncbi:YbhN family protein [Actinoplanes sp. NPDC051411]|uniref:lysylphosphatidylglycerol synthase transmembrane domain-containing protein n=1 Tax=Actinoplanes sp. NPDC051411 TaxID=3155522 RepID=UPI00343368A4
MSMYHGTLQTGRYELARGRRTEIGVSPDVEAGADPTSGVSQDGEAGAGRAAPKRWGRRAAVVAVLGILAAELVIGWPALTSALAHLSRPRPGWLAAGVVAEIAAMGAYARMQRRLLRSAGVRVPIRRHIALAYAAHSLSATLPGGPAFSTRFNYQQMRRFGATPAVASWCIALSGILSAAGLAVITAGGALSASSVPDWRTFAELAAALLLLTIGTRYLADHPQKLERAARVVLAGLNRVRRRPADHDADRAVDRVRGFVAQLRAASLTPGHATAAATHAVLNWLFDAACLWMCFQAVNGTSVRATQVLLAFCAGMAAGTITIVPGGLGIIDGALILGLVAGGAGTAAAISAVVLYRLISFGFVIGTGWITWLVIRRRR